MTDPKDVPPPDRHRVVAEPRAIPPGPARESELDWRRRPMVEWLAPKQLSMTAFRAILSDLFGAYADRREVQAALHQGDATDIADENSAPFKDLVYHYEDRLDAADAFWIDYVADLGDGFESTYTVAWLLGQPSLPMPQPGESIRVEDGVDPTVPRSPQGKVLILGGDQVYPTASRDEYKNRFSGPYRAARPWITAKPPPHMYAIPGNHDWYDGLTAFLRVFCQRRWMGGWKTQQRRSYFALQLPKHWWLLGLDSQLHSDIDQPQVDYFLKVAQQIQPGDRVILCTPEPVWVHTPSNASAFSGLAFFENTIIAPRGAELALTLTGDLHHYSRYEDDRLPEQTRHHKITAGGGGAYLLGTQILPDDLTLPEPVNRHRRKPEPPKSAHYRRTAAWPSGSTSSWLKLGALWSWYANPSFGTFLGCLYALFAWFLQSSSKIFTPIWSAERGVSYSDLMELMRVAPLRAWGDVFNAAWDATAHTPPVMMFGVLIIGALTAFCKPDVLRLKLLCRWKVARTATRVIIGVLHGTAHITLAIALMWLFSWINLEKNHLVADTILQTALFSCEMAVLGGTVGAMLFCVFLLPYVNYNEAFSAQHLTGYRNFLRLKLSTDGTVTVYPYGVRKVPRWKFRPNAPPAAPYYSPDAAPEVTMIEPPIVLAAPVAPVPSPATPTESHE